MSFIIPEVNWSLIFKKLVYFPKCPDELPPSPSQTLTQICPDSEEQKESNLGFSYLVLISGVLIPGNLIKRLQYCQRILGRER